MPRLSLAGRLAKVYLKLCPAKPPTYLVSRVPLERARMEYEDERAGGFMSWFSGLDLRGRRVLDLGCGYGGRTVALAEHGATAVTGIEIAEAQVREGVAFAALREIQNAEFLVAIGEQLPFADRSFDAIISFDVFEHVENLERVLAECHRVLVPGGSVYAVFPPFHHPTGGSHLHGYVSASPMPNVLFPCSALNEAIDSIMEERDDGYRPAARRPTDKLPSVNGTTIADFERVILRIPFQARCVRLEPLLSPMSPRWARWHMRRYAFLNRPLVRIPGLREVFVKRIVCDLRR